LWYAGCNEADLADQDGTVNTERCADRGFVNSSSISGGVVCYNETTAGSVARYICNDDFVLMENGARVCQSDGNWNGSIPQCVLKEAPGILTLAGGLNLLLLYLFAITIYILPYLIAI